MNINNFSQINKLLNNAIKIWKANHKKGTVTIYGSVAIMLNCRNNRTTMDIDITYIDEKGREQPTVLEELVVFDRSRDEQAWINGDMQLFNTPPPDGKETIYYRDGGLIVRVASPETLLAMKSTMERQKQTDLMDCVTLFKHLQLKSSADIRIICNRIYKFSNWSDDVILYWNKITAEALVDK